MKRNTRRSWPRHPAERVVPGPLAPRAAALALLITVIGLGSVMAADSVNFSGKLTVQNAGRGGGGTLTIVNLNQTGSTVTGSVIPPRIDSGTNAPVNMEIFGGKADGNSVSFYVWGGTDEPVKVTYRGTLSGDEIKFVVTGMPAPMGLNGPMPGFAGPREMTAKRAK